MSSYPNNLPIPLGRFIGREHVTDDVKRVLWTTQRRGPTGRRPRSGGGV